MAILSAVKTVTSKMPSTIKAAAPCKMADRGQITSGVLGGQLRSIMQLMWKRQGSRKSGQRLPDRAQILLVPA